MKKTIYSYLISGSIWFLASIFFTQPLLNAQVPQSFKYQAIVRDSKGQPITNTNISLRMSILNGNKADSTVYSETFANTTNSIGLASVELGTGIPISGSFTSINWSVGNYYLKLEVDPSGGSNWENLGTSRLLSVPYALFAGKVSNAPKLEVTGNAQYSADSALFEVKNRNGNTVFAVYEDGAVLYVKNSGKGGRGSFAVGGRSAKKGSTIQNIMIVSPDSVRVYLNDTIIAKGGRGGFAVGGRSNAKGSGNDLLFVNPSTTNISTQGNDGSFTIDNNSGGSRDWYAHLTPNNTFLGDRSGSNTTTGADNIFIGGGAGESNTTENSNILIGNSSGQFIHGGGGNVALGNRTAMYLSNTTPI